MFATTTIEQYLTGAGGSLKSQASYASILYALQEQLLAKAAGETARDVPAATSAAGSSMTTRRRAWCGGHMRPQRETSRASLALIALLMGTGCDGAEAGRVELGTDVVVHGATTIDVALTGSDGTRRIVRAAAKWAPLLAACVRGASTPDGWLIGGSATPQPRASDIADDARKDGVDFDLRAMRDTWLAGACVASGLPQLLTAAGLSWPGALDRIWPAVLERAARR
ncbi:MAG: hypothetical protein M5T61_20070 [Acidimicrobiia bacterium]|nr:hypothetical protein [Acidimicrobiia bacterium]